MEFIFWLRYCKWNVKLEGQQKVVEGTVVEGLVVEGTLVEKSTNKIRIRICSRGHGN